MSDALYTQLGRVVRSPAVRRKLAEVADRIAARAQVQAAADGLRDVEIGREDGTRPKGRPYARVTAPADQEWGTSETRRRALLARSLR